MSRVPVISERKEPPSGPSKGDFVLHCGHVLGARKHAVYAQKGIIYHVPAGPDGAMIDRKAFWIMLCDDCNAKCSGDYSKIGTEVKIRGEGQWQ